MPASPQLNLELLQLRRMRFGSCSLDPERARLAVFAQMSCGESRTYLAAVPTLPDTAAWAAELNQPCPVRVQVQPELREPLSQLGQETVALRFGLERPTTKSSALPHDDARHRRPRPPPMVGPQVENVV